MRRSDLADFLGALARRDEPGLAMGVYRAGELTAAAAGLASVEHGAAITEHTAFDIASVSKHLTATCMLLLARDGLVDLDADIRGYLPELCLVQPVTLRQCLTHTAGLRDYLTLCELAGIPVAGITQARFWHLITGQRELDFAPGSAFSYSNTGYVLAATVVRRVTGQSLAAFARDGVFGPLGMSATCFRDDVSVIVPRLATGYLAGPGGFRRCDVTEEVVGDGAVVTTIADLAGWHAFLANGDALGAAIRDGLFARQALTDGTRLGYALGLETIDVGGEPAWWHSGSWAGYRAAAIYLPASQAGVSVLANRDDHDTSQVAFAVALALRTGEDLRACYDVARGGGPAPAGLARQRASELAGCWHDPDQDLFADLHEVAPCGLALRAGAGAERALQLRADGAWHGTAGAGGTTYFVRDGVLTAGWGPSERPEGGYLRAGSASRDQLPAGAAAGTYRSAELGAYADLSLDAPGGGTITIGLAPARRLEPATDSAGTAVWRADDLTVRPAGDADPGAALLISAPGAHHVRFDRVGGAAPDRGVIRGLTGSTADADDSGAAAA